MTTSDWITIASILVPMLAGLGILIFRTGEMSNQLKTLSATVTDMNKRLDRGLKKLYKHGGRIKRLEKDVAKLNRAHGRP